MIISLIVAMDNNRGIGYQGKIPWRISSDLKRFKNKTMNHHILMGRKTYQSIGRPLPGRVNLVLSRNPFFTASGCLVFNRVESALQYAENAGETELFVIGGADLFAEMLPISDRMYITRVLADCLSDTVFPDFNEKDWILLDQIPITAGEKDDHDTIFQVYQRRSGTKTNDSVSRKRSSFESKSTENP